MAVTRREQQMIDLADAGLQPAEIAEQMQVKPATVKSTLEMLSGSRFEDRKRESAIAAGSARLRDAILAHGGY